MKINKFLLALSSSCLILCGCSKSAPIDYDGNWVFVTFMDYDGSVLYHKRITKGSFPEYEGPNPARDAPVGQIYTFTGWDKDIEQPIYESTIFNAEYKLENRKYSVQFLDYDDSLLYETNVEYGQHAYYDAPMPKRNSDDEHIEYGFRDWDKDIRIYTIKEDTIFKAVYNTFYYVFATFNNYDGTLLKRQRVNKGANVTYSGSTPTKPYEKDDKVYKFTGWDGDLKNLNEDKTFTAQFQLVNQYKVTFQNYNGSKLYEAKVAEGDTAIYNGPTPTKSSTQSGDYITTYTFSGWSPSITNVRSSFTTTAQFSSRTTATGKTAIINYLNSNGSGTYHNVSTGQNTTLGYSGSYFMPGFALNNGTMTIALAATFTFGSTSGTGTIVLRDNGTTTFDASLSLRTSNHYYYEYTISRTNVNKYTSTEDYASIITIIYQATSMAINNASNFLEYQGLPYIW